MGSSGAGNGGAATSPDGGSSSAPPLSPGGSGVVGGALSPGAGSHASTPAASCCDTPRPIITDPVSGQTVCSCQYDGARLALTSYPRLSSAAVGVYGAPYPSTDQNPYPSIGVDSSAFYSPLVSRPNFYLSFSSRYLIWSTFCVSILPYDQIHVEWNMYVKWVSRYTFAREIIPYISSASLPLSNPW